MDLIKSFNITLIQAFNANNFCNGTFYQLLI